MIRFAACAAVALAAGVGGLLFQPVFTLPVLLPPVAAVCVAVVVADLATVRGPAFLRPPLALLSGVLALVATALRPTLDGPVPTAATVRALGDGLLHGWLRTLESTWPARPEPQLLLFVPVLVLLSGVLGVECLRRDRSPLVALLPSLVLVGLSQAFAVAEGADAIGFGAAYTVAAVIVLAAARTSEGRDTTASGGGRPEPLGSSVTGYAIPAAVLVVAVVTGCLAFTLWTPLSRPAYSLPAHHQPPAVTSVLANPLDEIGSRLATPGAEAFRARVSAPVDRWTVSVLDRFDGVNWTSSARFRPLGSALAVPDGVAARGPMADAFVTLASAPGAWLPTVARTDHVEGTSPLVDAATGTLLSTQATDGLAYRLFWRPPSVDAKALTSSDVDGSAGGLEAAGQLPKEIAPFVREATGGLGPSLRTAFVLEQWFRTNYKVASGEDIPTGHGYAQLGFFLGSSKRGTSEQFATAYAVLARAAGLPVRVAVGFRPPPAAPGAAVVVHNGDVLAWPEIAVRGVGWVPLDPTGTAGADAGKQQSSVAQATDEARKNLPPQPDTPPRQAPDVPQPLPATGTPLWVWAVSVPFGLLVLAALAPVAVKTVRRHRRRRGTPAEAVVGAWLDARDRLRDRGVTVVPGMTPRDLAAAVALDHPPEVRHGLRRLSQLLDAALWSGRDATPEMARHAWSASDAVRAASSGTSGQRLASVLALRSLRPVRA
ncbi:transglutaminase domain-containing protein [Amycolatopsis sp. NPDC004169]|uniref:transglutaminase domain-containing protein n=1 Tax=Amycolatopsis sp. NPDC004169 TaxID=3154453 RepID=UPI0033B9A069